jgi:hypothetical protein
MKTKALYRFIRDDGGVSVSPIIPEDKKYTVMVRLVADEGKALTKDRENFYTVVDTDSPLGWEEMEHKENIYV